jgi:uncharacterized protein (DUF433 family)
MTAGQTSALVRDPEIQGGVPVFRGTRIPVAVMLDYLEAGETVNDFLTHYPAIAQAQAVAALEEIKLLLVPVER